MNNCKGDGNCRHPRVPLERDLPYPVVVQKSDKRGEQKRRKRYDPKIKYKRFSENWKVSNLPEHRYSINLVPYKYPITKKVYAGDTSLHPRQRTFQNASRLFKQRPFNNLPASVFAQKINRFPQNFPCFHARESVGFNVGLGKLPI